MDERKHKTEALVLKSRELGEADRLLTFLAPDLGKISAVARGARKTKSKLAAGVELFSRGDFILFRGKTLYTVTGQQIIERFIHLRQDPALYAYGVYFSELVERALPEETGPPPPVNRSPVNRPPPNQVPDDNRDIYHLLLNGWRSLACTRDLFLFARSFELKLLQVMGCAPHLDGCVLCGNENTGHYSTGTGGLLCERCLQKGGAIVRFPAGSAALARFLINREFSETGIIRATAGQKKELMDFNLKLLDYNLDITRCKSLDYINRLY